MISGLDCGSGTAELEWDENRGGGKGDGARGAVSCLVGERLFDPNMAVELFVIISLSIV